MSQVFCFMMIFAKSMKKSLHLLINILIAVHIFQLTVTKYAVLAFSRCNYGQKHVID